MKKLNRFKEVVTIWVGGIFLLGLVIAGWVPQKCPLLRQAFSSCPANPTVANAPVTEEEKDIARVPHQVLRSPQNLASFSVKSQENRQDTVVNFSYRGDLTRQTAYFALTFPEGMRRLALVSHPLLVNLTWPRTESSDPKVSLYDREGTIENIETFRSSLPPASVFVADEIAARLWSLKPNQYTPLNSLTSLTGYTYILTSYLPPVPDGGWNRFSHTFDLTEAVISDTQEIDGQVQIVENGTVTEPFRLSTVNLDYRFPGL